MDKDELILERLNQIEESVEKIREKVAPDYPNIDAAEKEGLEGILKHFDRIHDRLFSFNNMLIAGFFALTQLKEVNTWWIIVPLINLAILVWFEHIMKEYSRYKANIQNVPINQINKTMEKYNNDTALISLGTIISTTIVLIVFMIHLL